MSQTLGSLLANLDALIQEQSIHAVADLVDTLTPMSTHGHHEYPKPRSVSIKPDRSPEDRVYDVTLLKERWNLTQSNSFYSHVTILRGVGSLFSGCGWPEQFPL